MKFTEVLSIFITNIFQQIIIIFCLLIICVPTYFLNDKNYKTIILITPLSDLQFKSNFVFTDNFNLNFKIPDDSKIQNLNIETLNQDSINNLNLSPLNLFYSFYKETQNIANDEFINDNFKINFYGSTYEYFFSLEINSKNDISNKEKIKNIINYTEKNILEKVIQIERNYDKKILFENTNYKFVNYSLDKIVHIKNTINIYLFILIIILLSFLINFLVLKLRNKF